MGPRRSVMTCLSRLDPEICSCPHSWHKTLEASSPHRWNINCHKLSSGRCDSSCGRWVSKNQMDQWRFEEKKRESHQNPRKYPLRNGTAFNKKIHGSWVSWDIIFWEKFKNWLLLVEKSVCPLYFCFFGASTILYVKNCQRVATKPPRKPPMT